MSTRILTGFRLPSTNLTQILSQLKEIKKQARITAQNCLAETIIRTALSDFDDDFVKTGVISDKNHLAKAIGNVIDEQKQVAKTNIMNPSVDLSLEVVLFPRKKNTLGIYFGANKLVTEHIKTLPGWEDYSYWNNTDRPETVSNQEWKERKKVWDDVMPNNGTPIEHGLSFQLLPVEWVVFDINKEDEDVVLCETFENRAQRIAANMTVSISLNKLKERKPSINDILKMYHTVKNLPEYDKTLLLVKDMLIANPTIGMLRGKGLEPQSRPLFK